MRKDRGLVARTKGEGGASHSRKGESRDKRRRD